MENNLLDHDFPERMKSLHLSPGSKLIVMSDMHRGGTNSDEFAHNSLIFKCALEHYLDNGFTYIECSFMELYEGQAMADEVIAYLHEHGFPLQGIYDMSYDRKGRAVQGDFLFSKGRVRDLKSNTLCNTINTIL